MVLFDSMDAEGYLYLQRGRHTSPLTFTHQAGVPACRCTNFTPFAHVRLQSLLFVDPCVWAASHKMVLLF